MKKITIIAGLLALVSLTSCKKDYDCYVEFFGIKEQVGQCLDCSKSDAEDKEAELEAIVNASNDEDEIFFTLPVSCEKQ